MRPQSSKLIGDSPPSGFIAMRIFAMRIYRQADLSPCGFIDMLEYEVEGARPRGRPKKTWREIVEKDCKARGLNTEDTIDRSRWRKQIGMIDDHDE